MANVEVDADIWWAVKSYLRTLHRAGAVDEAKMKLEYYYPLEHCLKVWGIEPCAQPPQKEKV